MANHGVLVVDDDRRVLGAFGRALGRAGYEPALFCSYREALEAIEQLSAPPTAALFDIFLDRGNIGFELARKIRQRFSKPIAIAMVSGYSLSDTDADEFARDVDAVIFTKPVPFATCCEFVTQAWLQLLGLSSPVRQAVREMVSEYQLSPQEARIIAQLASGSVRSSLHNDLGLSRDTVKWQMKRLFARTRTTDTSELITLLLRRLSESSGSTAAAS